MKLASMRDNRIERSRERPRAALLRFQPKHTMRRKSFMRYRRFLERGQAQQPVEPKPQVIDLQRLDSVADS